MKNSSKFSGGGRGETPPKNKLSLEKLKCDENIWNVFIVKISTIFTPGLNIIKNIAQNLQPESHFGHYNKDFFFPKNLVQNMCNNFGTDQFNKTKLTGCALETIQHDLAK